MSEFPKENELSGAEVTMSDVGIDAPAEVVWDEEHIQEATKSLNEMYRQVSRQLKS